MRQKTNILLGLCFAAIYLAVFFSAKVYGPTSEQLQVSFLDIGQGDAIYIKAPNGKDMLIDGGKTSAALTKKLKNAMAPGDTSIDIVLATHPDADHIGGLPMIIENYSVGEFIEPGVTSGSKLYGTLLSDISTNKVPYLLARTGMTITLDDTRGITFTVLAPALIYEGEDTNDASIVGILKYGEKKFMLTGDAGVAAEKEILENRSGLSALKNISADVLKLGHHGSRTSTSVAFLEAVHPGTAIVSAGCNNSYGHPHQEVVARVAAQKILTFSTCISGTITFMTDGVTLSRSTEK
ncbi:MAG: MBL fold metallo-hydrolase [Candidatus Pacebacteria bacterium]|jgi:beta-lactamase superfamily II metal-dependent hydrolase|nr:MBL fold metallo-hydrolase [Candidatus Paceibacterota bacterium]